ncbi:MAG: hypothetical protein CVU56_16390 [Deltaproteobacteria bacterium HGW-Deltaproteobacteria-14]|jgi:copper(I)-binding protein|nr:MAG: hypothetical protein CVU56_16390 [Deltaproteobacteria bacterium HGW-Deltaproteobacteria-14]
MNRRDLAIIAKSAAMTMLVTLPILLPAAVSAGPDPIAQLGLAEQAPELEVAGATVTLALAKDHYKAGEAIALVATVRNPTDVAVHVAAKVQLVRIPYNSPISRMRSMPTTTFEAPVVLDLKPGETRVVHLETKVEMGDGDAAQLVASAGDAQVILATAAIGQRPKSPFDGPPTGLGREVPSGDGDAPVALPEGGALPIPAVLPTPTEAAAGLQRLAPAPPAAPAVAKLEE